MDDLKELACEYAGIAQRWLVVFSQAAQNRELKILDKAQAKELEQTRIEWRKLEGRTFNCQTDAEKVFAQFNQKWKYHQAAAKTVPGMQNPRRGRPSAEDQKEVVGYNLQGSLAVDQTALEEAKRSLGRFIVAANELDATRLPAQAMLENCKDQGVSVERGFRLFEDLDILLVKHNSQAMFRQLLNLRPAQEQVITLLGPQVQKCFLFGS